MGNRWISSKFQHQWPSRIYPKFIRFVGHALQKLAPCRTQEEPLINGNFSIRPKWLLTNINERVPKKWNNETKQNSSFHRSCLLSDFKLNLRYFIISRTFLRGILLPNKAHPTTYPTYWGWLRVTTNNSSGNDKKKLLQLIRRIFWWWSPEIRWAPAIVHFWMFLRIGWLKKSEMKRTIINDVRGSIRSRTWSNSHYVLVLQATTKLTASLGAEACQHDTSLPQKICSSSSSSASVFTFVGKTAAPESAA